MHQNSARLYKPFFKKLDKVESSNQRIAAERQDQEAKNLKHKN